MGLRSALESMKEAMAAAVDDPDVMDLRQFLKDNGLVQGPEAATLIEIMGNAVGRLVEIGVDPSALGTAASVMGSLAQSHIDTLTSEAEEDQG